MIRPNSTAPFPLVPDHSSLREPRGLSQMSSLIGSYDWDSSSLGPLPTWPDYLRNAVQLCLNSRFPMHIWWGPELINLYNDAFVSILGHRHPHALGKPAATVWEEVWPTLELQIEAVMKHGKSTCADRTHMILTRNGFPEDAWFTWSFAPICDGAGTVMGIHCVTIEETSRVLAEKSRTRLLDAQLAKEAGNRARKILESIPEAFFSLDKNWLFTYLNLQCFVLLGRKPEDLEGKNLWEEYPGLRGSPFEAIYRRVAEKREADKIVAYFPDHQRWYDVRVFPAEDGGLSVYFRDISIQKEIEEQRAQLLENERSARCEAERASRLKDEFLATLSHELRTPLNAVLGWCDILNHGAPGTPEELTDGLETIERNARAQAQIIADILDMSSIIAGKVRIVLQPLDLAEIIRGAVETTRPTAKAKQIQLDVTIDAGIASIFGDPNRLQQVFWNLLSNAVKFTPKRGRVEVRLNRVGSHLEVAIIDTGMGIPAAFLPHVFDRFRQADSSTTRQHGGLGLGLSIVKQLVEMHGGSIVASSAGPGQGASFVVSLPLSAVQTESKPAPGHLNGHVRKMRPPAIVSEGGITGVRVLVVDDELDARTLVKRILEDQGALVTLAASAQEAFAQLSTNPPDVLVSDIGMPSEDGYSLIQKVRALRPNQGGSVPALALTAYARTEDLERSILAGFQMHMAKPVDARDLVVMVASLSGSTVTRCEPVLTACLPREDSKAAAKPSRILLVEDHAGTRQVLANLLSRRQHIVIPVGTIAEARTVAEKEKFDLVISDLGLPDGSGNELMEEVQRKYGLKGIALSGYDREEDLIRSRQAGFVTHLVKPVSIGALEDALVLATGCPNL